MYDRVTILTLDDVLPHVAGREDFSVRSTPEYTTVDYIYALKDSFDHPVRRECRGLKFGPDGQLIARPFHKFFNLGEKQQIADVDWAMPHFALEKLDGSMVHSVKIGDAYRLMTRAGLTDVSRQAEQHLTDAHLQLIDHVETAGATAIFEFTAPDNRIVVAYAQPQITLTAVRSRHDGYYWEDTQLEALASHYGVPVVERYEVEDKDAFIAFSKTLSGMEGFILVFADGHRLKLKADEYVLQHRARSSVASPASVLQLILADGVDDVLPLLAPSDAERLAEYRDRVQEAITCKALYLQTTVDLYLHSSGFTRKQFALEVAPRLGLHAAAMFQILDGKDAREAVKDLYSKFATSNSKMKALEPFLGEPFAYNADLGDA